MKYLYDLFMLYILAPIIAKWEHEDNNTEI